MKNKILKSSLCCALCLLIFILAGCSKDNPMKSTEEDLRVVGSVGEFDVLYEELRFLALTYKASLVDTYGADIFNDPQAADKYESEMREYIYQNITANYAILKMCREVGIEADEQAFSDAVEREIESIIDSLGGKKSYKSFLRENFMTDNFFRFNTRVNKMKSELFYVYTDDLELIETENDNIYEIIKKEFVRTQHIYISKSNGKSYDENRALIEDAYSRAQNGEDFFSLASKYSEDEELTADGFYIVKGYMSEQYENVAFSLSENGMSGIIEDDSGFYIIKRLELDSVYIMMNFETLSDRYQQYTFLSMIDDVQKELEFVPNDFLKNINLLEIE